DSGGLTRPVPLQRGESVLTRASTVAIALALVACAAGGHAAETRPVDAALAEVGGALVTLSDVALARALGLFGLERSAGPVTEADVERYLEGQLLVREAAQFEIAVPPADVEAAWQAAGGDVLARRLEALGLDTAWARRLFEADLRSRQLFE